MSGGSASSCADLPSGTAIRFALKWQLVGMLLMASHVVLVHQSIFLTPLMLIALAWLYVHAPLSGIIVYLQILIYQNFIIGLLGFNMQHETFVVLQGTNFAGICLLATIAWTRVATPKWRNLRPMLIIAAVAIVVALVYMAIGAVQAGFTSASIYFRSTTALVFAVIVGLDLGRIYSFRTIALCFVVSAMLSMFLGYVEFSAPEFYYEWTNTVQFMVLKTLNDPKYDVFYSVADILVHNRVVLFNITSSDSAIEQIRFMGTVMHPISYAYVIAATALLAWSIGATLITAMLVPLLLLTGVKGANLMFMCSMVLWVVLATSRSRMFLTLSGLMLMVGYIGFGLISGEANRDYHVLGFLGGVNSLLTTPWGHGIGVGGNLSDTAAASGFKWERFQQQGASSFALESAVGVLFYQLGLASVAIFAVFGGLLKTARIRIEAYGQRITNRQSLMFIVLATVAVNGVFQEEAYAPTAAGLFTLVCAVIIANGDRPLERVNWGRTMGTKIAHVATQ